MNKSGGSTITDAVLARGMVTLLNSIGRPPFYIDQCVLCDIHMCSFYSGLAMLPPTAMHYPWYDAKEREEYAKY